MTNRFCKGQRWNTTDGKRRGEVVIFDGGRGGVVLITDDKGESVDRYNGTAAGFYGPGRWQVAA
jgi:hypothetical protein